MKGWCVMQETVGEALEEEVAVILMVIKSRRGTGEKVDGWS